MKRKMFFVICSLTLSFSLKAMASDVSISPIAYNPLPEDGAFNVPIDIDLSWMAGNGAISHDLYFSDDFTLPSDSFIDTLSSPFYNFGLNLNYATTYYWRVDEYDGNTVYQGDTWSFTTGEYIPEPTTLLLLGIGGLALRHKKSR